MSQLYSWCWTLFILVLVGLRKREGKCHFCFSYYEREAHGGQAIFINLKEIHLKESQVFMELNML